MIQNHYISIMNYFALLTCQENDLKYLSEI
jgi:hypothetical protein